VTKKNINFIWPLKREDLLRACVLALELGIDEVEQAAERVLTGTLAAIAADPVKSLLTHGDKTVRQRARRIYEKIHRSRVPHLRIQTLGGFQVYRGGNPIPDNEWTGRQSKTLLKAIVAHGGQEIPRDELVGALYAGDDSENMGGRFKVALHRLRKSLEPNMEKILGSSYVHVDDNRVSLDPELCEVDVHRFFQLAEKSRKAEAEGDVKGAEAFCDQAIALSSGEFLAGEAHPRWADEVNRKLGETYLELLMRTGGIHESRGAVKKAISAYDKAVEADPLREEAYRRLMTLYLDTGRRNEALKVFNKCKLALAEGLDTDPDEMTYAVYRKITER
jgi:DNA-binding SARP family transcriptional activator